MKNKFIINHEFDKLTIKFIKIAFSIIKNK